ncbi:MAG TPA: cupin domain-containing protein [Elusimicrobiota bacterium]|nr:cupin domain-containing protein [Elusimicrobiota bacterium]
MANVNEIRDRGFELAGVLEYQEGAVVSRTLLERKTGTVTVFAFDEGQGLTEHTSLSEAMVYVLDGEADISLAGKTHRLKAGEMLLMPANVPHALRAVKKFKMLLILLRP